MGGPLLGSGLDRLLNSFVVRLLSYRKTRNRRSPMGCCRLDFTVMNGSQHGPRSEVGCKRTDVWESRRVVVAVRTRVAAFRH